MPKFGIHSIVLDQIIEKLSDDAPNNTDSETLSRILKSNSFAANLGAIGPDLLFWAPDYAIAEHLDPFVKAYDGINKKIKVIKDFGETIKVNIEEGVDGVIDALRPLPIIGPMVFTIEGYHEAFERISHEIEVLAESIKTEIRLAIFVKILGLDSQGSDGNTMARSILQGVFQSSQQAGREEMEWYWFEMLHYRNTGDFARKLIELAEKSGDEELMAYAYAYVSHYATDLVGHPYVNTISGAPYRIAVQRHVVIENFMDQWKWINSDGEFNTNIRNELFEKMGFEDVVDLPDSIAGLIADALFETYKDLIHPLRYIPSNFLAESKSVNPIRDGFLNANDIKTAYRLQRRMLKILGGQEHFVKPQEPDGADEILSGLDLPSPSALPNTNFPTSANEFLQDIDEWFTAMANYLNWATDSMKIIATKLGEAISNFIDNPALELRKLIEALAYALELIAYDIYRWIHQILALAGLVYPEPDDVNIDENVNNSAINSDSQVMAEKLITIKEIEYKKYPILKTPGQPHLDIRSHLKFMDHEDHRDFVGKKFEAPFTTVSHYTEENNKTPDVFINIVPLDTDLLTKYARAAKPEETIQLQDDNKKSFGNAVDLSIYILHNRSDDDLEDVVFCNWNLDGDRGYGYKSWDGIPFTVAGGEMDGAISGNESLEQVLIQDFAVTSKVKEVVNGRVLTSKYESEIYIDDKSFTDSLIAVMDISEEYIPKMFKSGNLIPETTTERWINLVPTRFKLHTGTFFNNSFFCNGILTTPCSGLRSNIDLQLAINKGLVQINNRNRYNVKLLHNYTALSAGNFRPLVDVGQAFFDYMANLLINHNINIGCEFPIPDVINPTQISVMALLHHFKKEDLPLLLSGHSQGTIIIANAIMAFSTLGKSHRDFLKQKVKVLHMEPEILNVNRANLRSLVKEYLVYIMNASDLAGTDVLIEMTGGDFPLIPGQTRGLVTNSDTLDKLGQLFSNPDLLNLEYYSEILSTIGTSGNTDIVRLIDYLSTINMGAHFIPNQLSLITNDISNNLFRTDPGVLSNPSQQLSTLGTLDSSSINVRNFFTS